LTALYIWTFKITFYSNINLSNITIAYSSLQLSKLKSPLLRIHLARNMPFS